jgi:FSR family fosmidomycin resistance protein-like MFS transporter
MTTAAHPLRTDVKVIGLVCVAHLMSHFYLLVVPPIFFLLTEEFGVGYAAMGFAASMLYLTSGLLQTPAGFLVDRLGGKTVLAGGLAVFAGGTLLIGLAPSYPLLVAAFMIAGAGNSVFHPADMAILNARIDPLRLGYAFSVHAVSGNLGWVLAPLFSVAIATAFGWRTALIAAGAIGLAIALLLALQPVLRTDAHVTGAAESEHIGGGLRGNLKLLLSVPVLTCFSFFVFSSMTTVGLQTFSIPAMIGLYGVAVTVATGTLTGYLLGAVAGTLAGGFIASRTHRHDAAAITGILAAMLFVLALASGVLPRAILFLTMALAGFFVGTVNPSRDIIVRNVTPAHARGRVYGFVYSGIDLGSSVGPPIAGWLLDTGRPQLVFLASAGALFLCAATMLLLGRARHSASH